MLCFHIHQSGIKKIIVFYQDGDVIVCGMVPIHNKDNLEPLKCNGIRTKLGVEIGEALAFAVSLVNQKNGKYRCNT
jgi:hypothetical protein